MAVKQELPDTTDTLGLYRRDMAYIAPLTEQNRQQLFYKMQIGRASYLLSCLAMGDNNHEKTLKAYLSLDVATNFLNDQRLASSVKPIAQEEVVAFAWENGQVIDSIDIANLNTRIEEGRKARRELIERNLPLVLSATIKFRGLAPDSDLIQGGNLGLIRAVEGYDFTRGYAFSSYATPCIRQEIIETIINSRHVPVPHSVNDDLRRINRFFADFFQEKGREPTSEEIASKLNLTAERVSQLNQVELFNQTLSLEAPVGSDGDGTNLGDFIADPESEHGIEVKPDLIEFEFILSELVKQKKITPWQMDVFMFTIKKRATGEKISYKEIGLNLGKSQHRVKQIVQGVTRKLIHLGYANRLKNSL